MKVLIVGSGGREHALAWKIAQSEEAEKVFAAPGNAGIAQVATCIPIQADEVVALARFAEEEGIGLTVVGPEAPLAKGITDIFRSRGLPIFGPTAEAAELESSKVFAKQLMRAHGIPTADFRVFDVYEAAKEFASSRPEPMVVKADGLAAGKGVVVCETREEALSTLHKIMIEKTFGEAGSSVIIEDKIEGVEASILAVTDGETILPLPPAQDYKRAYDGNSGPNTGGMGAYSPAPVVDEEMYRRIEEEILVPIVHAMKAEGHPFSGVIYAGLMITEDGPMVLEFNVRFGDPETQPIMMKIEGDILPILHGAATGTLEKVENTVAWGEKAAVCVVMASEGYPGNYTKGKPITGVEEAAQMEDVMVFHAGTALDGDRLVTAGGRVLGVTARGKSIQEARERAYEAVEKIHFDGARYRKDIASGVTWP